MNVTIIGAGISGLGLAIKLEKYKINYEIIEQKISRTLARFFE
mgnify:CR=1 FL=1